MQRSNCVSYYDGCCILTDPLVLHFQLIHDGHLPGGVSQHDPHEGTQEGLCQVQQGG